MLNEDIRGWPAQPCLPELGETQTILTHELNLQIVSAFDAGVPAHASHASSGSRLIRLQLTDARSSQCGAFEYQSLGHVPEESITPGAKLRVKSGARFVRGMLLLEPSVIEFLGGWVEALASASEKAKGHGELGTVYATDSPPRFVPLPDLPAQSPQAAVRTAAPPACTPTVMSSSILPQRPTTPQRPKSPQRLQHVVPLQPPPQRIPPMQRMPASGAASPPPKSAQHLAQPPVQQIAPRPQHEQAPEPASASLPPLDPDMVADLLAIGLSLEEIHEQLGHPPPTGISSIMGGSTGPDATEVGASARAKGGGRGRDSKGRCGRSRGGSSR